MRVVPSAEGSLSVDSTWVRPVRLKPRVGAESDGIPASPAFPIPADAGVGVRVDGSRPLTPRVAGSAPLSPTDNTASRLDGPSVVLPPVSSKGSPAIRGVVKPIKIGGTTLNGVSNKKRDRNPPVITGPGSPAILENGPPWRPTRRTNR